MKLSEFKNSRPAAAKLIDGVELNFRYLPRFMTSENIEAYNDFLMEQGDRTEEAQFDAAYKYLAAALEWVDIQDEKGKDLVPSFENLKNIIRFDMPTIMAIHAGIFTDIEKRANPTLPAGEDSSAGSTEAEKSIQMTLPMTS